MSIFITAVLIFVYGYCSSLEAAIDPMEPMGSAGGFDGNYYDSHRRLLSRFRDSCGSRNWNLEKFKQ